MLFQLSGISQMAIYRNDLGVIVRSVCRPAASPSTDVHPLAAAFFLTRRHSRRSRLRSLPALCPTAPPAVGHMAISDPSGDSANLEYVKGKLVIHHGRQYQVMTNSSPFDDQLTLDAYWREIGGLTMLPGTNRAADRFVRATFYVKSLPQTADSQRAVAQVFSVIRSVSVPLGFTMPDKPNITSTVWRTAYDQKNRVVYFDSATSPSVFWLKIGDLLLAPGSPEQRLPLADAQTYGGDAKAGLLSAEPFAFLPANAN